MMNYPQNFFKKSQLLGLKEWKEKIGKFIKESILDIVKFRINKNACDSNVLDDNEFEHINIDSCKLNNNHEKNINKINQNAFINEQDEGEYDNLRANDIDADRNKKPKADAINPVDKTIIDQSLNFYKNNIVEKISHGFLYLNFKELEDFQHLNFEYYINISILFRRRDIKFVIENWSFEVNLNDEIYNDIIKKKNFARDFNFITNIQNNTSFPKKTYVYKKLEVLARSIKSLLNILPAIKFFHSNTFDFYLDFELNFQEINKTNPKSSLNNLNTFYDNNNINNKQVVKNKNNKDLKAYEKDELSDSKLEENLEIFRMNSNKIKENQQFIKENCLIPIKKQIECIKILAGGENIFNIQKYIYSDKIGKIKMTIEYLEKHDVFIIEDEIKKNIIYYEKINKRKRFLSENSNDIKIININEMNKIENININVYNNINDTIENNKNSIDNSKNKNDQHSQNSFQNSLIIDQSLSRTNIIYNNTKNVEINTVNNFSFNPKNNLEKNKSMIKYPEFDQDIILSLKKNNSNIIPTNSNTNNFIKMNKSTRLFNNLIKSLERSKLQNTEKTHMTNNNIVDVNSVYDINLMNKSSQRINCKSEERNNDSPQKNKYNKISEDKDIFKLKNINSLNREFKKKSDKVNDYSPRDYSPKPSFENINSEETTISTKNSYFTSFVGNSFEENQLKENDLRKLENLKNKFDELHQKFLSDTSNNSFSIENSIDENEKNSIELIIEEEEHKAKIFDNIINFEKEELEEIEDIDLNKVISKIKKLKKTILGNPFEIAVENFNLTRLKCIFEPKN